MSGRYVTTTRLAALAGSLSPQAWQILGSLDRVRIASGRQLERLHFASVPSPERQCRRLLRELTERGVIIRLERRVGGVERGSGSYCYVLARTGQRLLDRPGPAGRGRQRRPWTPGLPFLRHSLAVTETYVRLVEAERRGACELLDWVGEPGCWRRFTAAGGPPAVLKPDALVRLALGDYVDAWFLEADRGTESPATLVRKLDAYRAYWTSGREQATNGVFPRILWLVPDAARAELVRELADQQPQAAGRLHLVRPFDELVPTVLAGADA
ncbi:MAG: replication-relaxation family protein [Frankiaceae bacterium]